MRVLVTGGAGFIGSHTVRALLTRGEEVSIVDDFNDYYSPAVKRANVAGMAQCRLYEGDICDLAFLREVFTWERPEKVCHLAARAGVRPSIAEPMLYERVNVQGTLNILQCCIEHEVANLVYASSSSVYGNHPEVPFREDMQLDRPISPYAATKKACELMAYTYHHLHGLNCTGLRFFTVYGPAGRPDMAPFIFTRNVMDGVPIKRFGDGSTRRDYTYIDDIVAGVLAALDREHAYEVINLGNGRPIELSRFIELVEEAVGRKAIIEELPMQPGDVTQTYADITKAQRLLGYDPRTPFEQGLTAFVEWYREHRGLYG